MSLISYRIARFVLPATALSLGALTLAACNGGRDVEVSGEANAQAQGTLHVDFYEPAADGKTQGDRIATQTLPKPGAFKQTVNVKGDTLHVVAFVDADNNGACTNGEAWAEATPTITNDKVSGVTLDLKTGAPCPALTTAKK